MFDKIKVEISFEIENCYDTKLKELLRMLGEIDVED